jgi:hypothetical protein
MSDPQNGQLPVFDLPLPGTRLPRTALRCAAAPPTALLRRPLCTPAVVPFNSCHLSQQLSFPLTSLSYTQVPRSRGRRAASMRPAWRAARSSLTTAPTPSRQGERRGCGGTATTPLAAAPPILLGTCVSAGLGDVIAAVAASS